MAPRIVLIHAVTGAADRGGLQCALAGGRAVNLLDDSLSPDRASLAA